MTTTTTGEPAKEVSREAAYLRRVMAAHHDGSTAALRRWRPGTFDPAVVALTQDATPTEYDSWALAGKLFVLTSRGPSDTWLGENNNGIGRWTYWAKPRDSDGKLDPQAERIIKTITRTESFTVLAQALTGLAAMTTQTTPNWLKVLRELTAWQDPSMRTQVRYVWAQDFYTPKKKAAQTA